MRSCARIRVRYTRDRQTSRSTVRHRGLRATTRSIRTPGRLGAIRRIRTLLVSGADGPTPTFDVPEEVDEDETYEYLLTVSAENAEDATAEVTVTVLNRGALAVACADPGSVYEGSADIAFDCSASGAPGDDPQYTYAWTARGDTPDTSLLSVVDVSSPMFLRTG